MFSTLSSNLGYPRIGENREWKKALESFWAGKLEEKDLLKTMEQIRLSHLEKQQQKGIDLIPVGDFTFYDQMLDMAVMFGLVPKRFSYEGGVVPLETYFAMARGSKNAVACEMTKWFNTNYHYIVPEYNNEDHKFVLTENKPLLAYREAKEKLNINGKPVIIGPYTFIKLTKGYDHTQLPAFILQIIPLYEKILKELEQEGVEWIQMDEPILVTSLTQDEMKIVSYMYEQLHQAAPNLRILLQTYFDSIECYPEVMQLPVQGIGLDFVHGKERNLQLLQKYGFPQDKILGVGLVDGRNIWRSHLTSKLSLMETLSGIVSPNHMIIQPSSSLLHIPVSVRSENQLHDILRESIAFADEKLDEVICLTKGIRFGKDSIIQECEENDQIMQKLNQADFRNRIHVQQKINQLHQESTKRKSPFSKRYALQQEKWKLPVLPTTTIGSFPQTNTVRQARRKWRAGEWTHDQYDQFIKLEIKDWINIQEDIGIDVLVHGEFERTDMVEFFGEKLGGFAFTKNGWVQSYGSRCVKPPIIYGDVEFIAPMTVKETLFAKSLTNKPVKGMLTGPITILNWSFVRDDLSRQQVAYQIAFALRNEVEALEKNGIQMIQVDEPALREGLPLKKEEINFYLDWAVYAFRITTSSVQDETQIHTHMCYCEFQDIIESIKDLDADVISIETSRSHGELISSFEDNTYDKGIGLGVFDIHSPRVPKVQEMADMIQRALQVLNPNLFWINPDCGLKTRGIDETVASLENMVKATKLIREKWDTVNENLRK